MIKAWVIYYSFGKAIQHCIHVAMDTVYMIAAKHALGGQGKLPNIIFLGWMSY